MRSIFHGHEPVPEDEVTMLKPTEDETHIRCEGKSPSRKADGSDHLILEISENLFQLRHEGKNITSFYLELTTVDDPDRLVISYEPEGREIPDDEEDRRC
jgi:hypothetical protein